MNYILKCADMFLWQVRCDLDIRLLFLSVQTMIWKILCAKSFSLQNKREEFERQLIKRTENICIANYLRKNMICVFAKKKNQVFLFS